MIIGEAMPAIDAEVGVIALVSVDGRTLTKVGFEGVDAGTRNR